MADLHGVQFDWRPETTNGVLTSQDIGVLQRSLTASRSPVGQIHPHIPLDMWAGEHEVLVALQMPGFRLENIKVNIKSRELQIHAENIGEEPVDQSLALPFRPDPETVRILYIQGTLYIHAIRPSSPDRMS